MKNPKQCIEQREEKNRNNKKNEVMQKRKKNEQIQYGKEHGTTQAEKWRMRKRLILSPFTIYEIITVHFFCARWFRIRTN